MQPFSSPLGNLTLEDVTLGIFTLLRSGFLFSFLILRTFKPPLTEHCRSETKHTFDRSPGMSVFFLLG